MIKKKDGGAAGRNLNQKMGFERGAGAFLEPCARWLCLTFLVAGVLQIGPAGSVSVVTAPAGHQHAVAFDGFGEQGHVPGVCRQVSGGRAAEVLEGASTL